MAFGKCIAETVLGIFVGTVMLLTIINLSIFINNTHQLDTSSPLQQKIQNLFTKITNFFKSTTKTVTDIKPKQNVEKQKVTPKIPEEKQTEVKTAPTTKPIETPETKEIKIEQKPKVTSEQPVETTKAVKSEEKIVENKASN